MTHEPSACEYPFRRFRALPRLLVLVPLLLCLTAGSAFVSLTDGSDIQSRPPYCHAAAQPKLTTDYNYDTYGRVTSVTVTDTTTSETRITAYTYDSNTTDGSGNTILGRLAQVNGPRTDVTDTTDYDYDANFNLTTIEDVNDVETDLVYSSAGRLTSSTVAPGTALEAETAYAYDPNGNLTQVTLPNAVTVEYSYDNAQRLTGVEDALGNTIAYTLDAAGNITQEDYSTSTPTLKYTHDQVFDELSRIIESVGASAQTSEFAYDKNSNLTAYTDANTNATALVS